jgi:hypothetical protein
MLRTMNPIRRWLIIAGAVLLGAAAPAYARREAADLQRAIETQRAAISDLERLDDRRSVTDEITLQRSWLDEALSQHAKEAFDKVREILDRCDLQAEMIRQKITASRLTAQAADREQAVRASRERVERTKRALLEATATKKALEMNSK